MARLSETVTVADPMLPRIARVVRSRREYPQTVTLELEPEHASDHLLTNPFLPGQFTMLGRFGVGELPISVSGDPAEHERLDLTIREVGAVTAALTHLASGEVIGIRGPFGQGWPMTEAAGRDVVIVAGGLGLAPLRPALHSMLAQRDEFGRIVLLYGTRAPNEILFRHQLQAWRRQLDIDIQVSVDRATAAWHGQVGVVTRLIPRAAFNPSRAIAFVCGPEIMMRFSVAALRDVGVAEDAIYVSLERNMKCGVGLCGHCQFGPVLVCREGPVFRSDRVRHLLGVMEL
jgi:NAD(P)H-flavin reductase